MRLWRRTRLFAALVVGLVASSIVASPVAARGDQLKEVGVETYELQPARGVVHVTEVLKLTNQKTNHTKSYACTRVAYGPYGPYTYSSTCTYRTNWYYYSYTFWVEDDARNFKASANSGSVHLKVLKRDRNGRHVKISHSPIYSGQTRTITFSYDLPGGGPRSTAARRVGYAWASFCGSGPGSDSGEMRIVVPAGFTVAPTQSMHATARAASASGHRAT